MRRFLSTLHGISVGALGGYFLAVENYWLCLAMVFIALIFVGYHFLTVKALEEINKEIDEIQDSVDKIKTSLQP